FGPAANGSLVFSRGGDILAVDAPTGQERTIIGDPANDSLPWFAPDGQRFAFVRGDLDSGAAELWLAEADGGAPRRLATVTPEMVGDWSPGGDAIAMTGGGDPSAITLVDTDGGPPTTIATGLDAVDGPIFRPPDGASITFRGRGETGDWGIYLVD